MVGVSRKFGRGGGGTGNRSIQQPPIRRPSPATRLSLGGDPRGRGSASAAAIAPSTSSPQVEENFSLVRDNPLNFAMAIKLTPDLVEEIRRVEAQGSTARIKFNANPCGADGNVISVGDKNFKFTWSKEIPDLCDIYEERRSGEEGNGLLVESGSAWRKLNVQRVLDESTQNHVKMRSEEAERKLKSRKAVMLDQPNSSMKNQMKALAAAESNQWRNFKNKKEPPPRKLKTETTPAVGPQKPVYKPGLSTTTPSKGKPLSGSPLSSQPEQYGAPASPFTSGNPVKGHAIVPDVSTTHKMNKTFLSDKETHSRLPSSTSGVNIKNSLDVETKPSDLRSLIISVLLENHSKGMSLKALEKAIGDTMSCSARQIEPILKQVATFQAPGRYFLKQGAEMESLKKPPSESGRSPQINHHKSPASQKLDQPSAQDPTFVMRTAVSDEEQAQLRSTPLHAFDTVEKVDILHNSPDHLSHKKVSDNSEGLQGSSSGSDSDSESDGTDSDSDSESHSKSSSSESDASSSSKQASDEDAEVDIMWSDDDKESKDKLRDSDPVSLKSPVQLRHPDSDPVDIGDYEKHYDHDSDVVDIEKESPVEKHEAARSAAYLFTNQEGQEPVEEIKSYSAHCNELQEIQFHDIKLYTSDSGVNDGFKPGQSADRERLSKGKSKWRSDDKYSDERPQNSKRLMGKNSSELVSGTISMLFGENANASSPDKPLQPPNVGPDQIKTNFLRDGTNGPSSVPFNQGIPTKSTFDSQQPIQRSFQPSRRSSGEKTPGKRDRIPLQKKGVESHNEDILSSKKSLTRFSSEGIGDRNTTLTESNYRRPEMHGKPKEAGPHYSSVYSPKETNMPASDRSPVMNGRALIPRREVSDLELGELREPPNDENSGPKKQFERKDSFIQLENRPTDSSDSSRKKASNKIIADSRKLTPPSSEAVASGIRGGSAKRKALDHDGDDYVRTHSRATTTLIQQHHSSRAHIEVANEHNKGTEMSRKSGFAEAGTDKEASLEARTKTSRKVPVNGVEQQQDPVQKVVPHSMKGSKKQKTDKVGESNRQKDASLTGSIDSNHRRRKSSSDDNSCSYTKYEKEEPELKGPIKNATQYREYVKEYQEKYDSYFSLNKILESYRDEFSNLGKDLETYRDRDMKKYHDILRQIKSSFHQCGEKHKRLKKIFVVLYEELKNLKQMIKHYAASYTKG